MKILVKQYRSDGFRICMKGPGNIEIQSGVLHPSEKEAWDAVKLAYHAPRWKLNMEERTVRVMMKHTPGPWFVGIHGDVWNQKTGGCKIAECNGNDANIIAAAPEILDALIKSYKMMCKYCNAVESLCKGSYVCNEKKYRASVIERATGLKIEEYNKRGLT